MSNTVTTEVMHRVIDLLLEVGFIIYQLALGFLLLCALSYTVVLIFTFDFKRRCFVRPSAEIIIILASGLFLPSGMILALVVDRKEFLGVKDPPIWFPVVVLIAIGFTILLAVVSLILILILILSYGPNLGFLFAEPKSDGEKAKGEATSSSAGSAVSSGGDESSENAMDRQEEKKSA